MNLANPLGGDTTVLKICALFHIYMTGDDDIYHQNL